MIKRITFTALLIGSVATGSVALAQNACAPRDQVVTKLEGTFGESRMGAGLRGSASIFEIWASADSGTWTILVTDTQGISCIMASGESWHDMPAIAADLGAPA